jgi:hypothetical protein
VKTPASLNRKISQPDLQQLSLGASATTIDLQDQKSSTKCLPQRQGEWGADGTPEFDIFTSGELRSKFGDPPSFPCWKTKEQGKITQTQGMLEISIS